MEASQNISGPRLYGDCGNSVLSCFLARFYAKRIPLLAEEGCLRRQPAGCGADGVVSSAEIFRPKHLADLPLRLRPIGIALRATPSAALRWLRDFLSMPQPPLCEEGNITVAVGASSPGIPSMSSDKWHSTPPFAEQQADTLSQPRVWNHPCGADVPEWTRNATHEFLPNEGK